MKFIKLNENVCCEDVIQCIFNLNNQDIIVYKKLQKTGEIRADKLADLLNKDRSTIYRSLQRLTCSELCVKETKNIQQGGYYHTYRCNNIKNVKQKLQDCIDKWYEKMSNTIKELN